MACDLCKRDRSLQGIEQASVRLEQLMESPLCTPSISSLAATMLAAAGDRNSLERLIQNMGDSSHAGDSAVDQVAFPSVLQRHLQDFNLTLGLHAACCFQA